MPLRKRLRARLPSGGRVLAVLGFAVTVGGLVALINGPWLRVTAVAHDGLRYTPDAELDAILDGQRGTPLLGVDSEALRQQLMALPAVAGVKVELLLPGELRVSIHEKRSAFVWRTSAVKLVGAADGTIIAELPLVGELEDDLAKLPHIQDERLASRGLTVGDVLPAAERRVAMRLVALDPEVIGSRARQLTLRLDDQFGFLLTSSGPPWDAALGFYELDPREDQAAADARLEEQLAAIRTLFATRREVAVSWLDARNPGKVYWAP
jgi:cell division septal protein FtsQ